MFQVAFVELLVMLAHLRELFVFLELLLFAVHGLVMLFLNYPLISLSVKRFYIRAYIFTECIVFTLPVSLVYLPVIVIPMYFVT